MSTAKIQNPANIYLLKFNNRNTWKRFEICSKLTRKSQNNVGVFIFNFEDISHLVIDISIVDFEKVNN